MKTMNTLLVGGSSGDIMKTVTIQKCRDIIAAVNAAVADDTEILIEPAVYHVHQSECRVKTYNITNSTPQHNADKFGIPYDHHLMITAEGKKNVTIDGQGAKFICHGKMTPFSAFDCNGITFKNITVDYADPTVMEMEVLEIGDGYSVVQVHPDSKYRIEGEKVIWYGENFEFYDTKHYYHIYHPQDDCMRKYGFSPMADETARYFDLGDRKIKITYQNEKKNPYNFIVGGIAQFRDGVRDECGAFFWQSKNISVLNVTMHFMHGLGFVSQCSENITLDRVTCAPDPDSGRICSCFADGSQFSNCRGQINITNCVFRGLHDDPVNIHGTYLKIVRREGRDVILKFIQQDSFNFNVFRDGDTISSRDPEYFLKKGEAKVVKSELCDPYHIRVSLDRDADAFEVGMVCENLSANPNVYIAGCHSSRVTTKGFLTGTSGKVVIENNTFVNFRRPCVLLACDTQNWYESGPVRDVTIRNNLHINCTEEPIYVIKPENTRFSDTEFVNSNILIENNRAEGGRNAWLYAKSTDNIVMRNNLSDFIPLPPILINCGKIVTD